MLDDRDIDVFARDHPDQLRTAPPRWRHSDRRSPTGGRRRRCSSRSRLVAVVAIPLAIPSVRRRLFPAPVTPVD
jgi:hypothetical protein